jgi:two-component system, OmpR family, response regulator
MDRRVEERVLVIDESALERREVCARLGSAGFTVLAESSSDELGPLLDVYQPDLTVIEVDGHEPHDLVHTLRERGTMPVILLLRDGDLQHRLKAIQAGADDVIVKPFAVDELVARVGAVLERSGRHRDLIRLGDLVIDEGAHTAHRGDAELDLTITEFNLLTMLALNSGLVISKRQLLSKVWGFEFYRVNVVEVHVCALRRKLEAHGPRLIHTVRGVGYVLRPAVERMAAAPVVRSA